MVYDLIDHQTPPRVDAGAPSAIGNSHSLYALPPPTALGSDHRQPHRPHPPQPQPQPQPQPRRSYYRPGKAPAATFEPDVVKLRTSCAQRGGSKFAVDWVLVVFKHGVTTDALLRTLDRGELDLWDVLLFSVCGFPPRQVFDGFLVRAAGDRYACGLCCGARRTLWKNRKDAPRHLRKFHFGLADICKNWCVRSWVVFYDGLFQLLIFLL